MCMNVQVNGGGVACCYPGNRCELPTVDLIDQTARNLIAQITPVQN